MAKVKPVEKKVEKKEKKEKPVEKPVTGFNPDLPENKQREYR